MQVGSLRQSRAQRDRVRGFTIIELLIVIVIIAILATITIVAYTGITSKANGASAESAASQVYEAVDAYMATNNGTVPTTLAAAGVTNQGNTSYQYSYTSTTFCATATTSNVSYWVNNTTQTTPVAGACPGQGVNGVPPITNLLTNPSIEAGTSYWSAVSGATLTVASSPVHSGSSSAQIVTTSANASQGVFISGANSVVAGNVYSGGLWVDAPSGVAIYCSVRVNTASQVYDQNPYTRITGNGSWQYCALGSVTAPTGATSIQVYARTYTAQATTFYVDDAIAAQASSVAGYADGNTTNWVWNGTPNSSTSTGPPPQ